MHTTLTVLKEFLTKILRQPGMKRCVLQCLGYIIYKKAYFVYEFGKGSTACTIRWSYAKKEGEEKDIKAQDES